MTHPRPRLRCRKGDQQTESLGENLTQVVCTFCGEEKLSLALAGKGICEVCILKIEHARVTGFRFPFKNGLTMRQLPNGEVI